MIFIYSQRSLIRVIKKGRRFIYFFIYKSFGYKVKREAPPRRPTQIPYNYVSLRFPVVKVGVQNKSLTLNLKIKYLICCNIKIQ